MKQFILVFILSLLLQSGNAWAQGAIAYEACNGTNEGVPCFSTRGLPGTCVNNAPPVPPATSSGGFCQENANPDGTCTFSLDANGNPIYGINYPAAGQGIIATIVTDVKNILMGTNVSTSGTPLYQQLFNGITSNQAFINAAIAALTLYVIFYAIAFTLGMVQLTIFDFLMRISKVAVVGALVNGEGLFYFTETFVNFFDNGTDNIISAVSRFSAPDGSSLGGQPFDWMDDTIVELSSTKMMVTLMAAATTGPYGILVVAILTISLYVFIKSMLQAVWVYLMALCMRTLLFGLAPFFLSCILFTRTRSLFDGWLNQVVNSCLQPIFLFAFFSFFVLLIKSVLDQVVNLDVCWTETALFAGSPNLPHYWRFAVWSCTKQIWIPFVGEWSFNGPENTGCPGNPVHPVGMILPITLWIITDLAKRFNNIVITMAKDISNASTEFRHQGNAFGAGSPRGGGNPGGGANPKPPQAAWTPKPGNRVGPPDLKKGERPAAATNLPNQGKTAAESAAALVEHRKNPVKPFTPRD